MAHLPRSILRQRSLQKGKSSSPGRTIIAQVGQWRSLADFFRGDILCDASDSHGQEYVSARKAAELARLAELVSMDRGRKTTALHLAEQRLKTRKGLSAGGGVGGVGVCGVFAGTHEAVASAIVNYRIIFFACGGH